MSSVLKYFTRAGKGTSSIAVIPTAGAPGISDREISNIAGQIQSTSRVKLKRVTYNKLDKTKITKHANEGGIVNVVAKHCSQFGANVPNSQIVISVKRAHPPYLHEELDKKLCVFITHIRVAVRTINYHVVLVFKWGLLKVIDLIKP